MRHGEYWTIAEGQDTSGVYTSYGVTEPHGVFGIKLTTIESDNEDFSDPFMSERWFEPLPKRK
jgi:hypothetical protein